MHVVPLGLASIWWKSSHYHAESNPLEEEDKVALIFTGRIFFFTEIFQVLLEVVMPWNSLQ